jgi:diadenosine tetraphosphate (Ap4A) HIT family hydrolase
MSAIGFALEDRLARGGEQIAALPLCLVLLKHDARWPWIILVPQRADLAELHDLSPVDAAQLMLEVRAASAAIAAEDGVEKINVAALGNILRQLHIHVVGRWLGDPAWPDPMFGLPGKIAYEPDALISRMARLRDRLGPLAH